MPKHGFARHSEFAVVKQDSDMLIMRLSATDQTRAIYPFEFQLDVEFRIEKATLTVAATIANHGTEIMPASLGFHPAFRWPLNAGTGRPCHIVQFPDREPSPVRRIGTDGLLIDQA